MLGFGLSNVYCRFLWFKPRFWEKCLRWIQAKKYGLWGSKEACKEAQNTPRIAKPAAQGKALNKTKTQRTGQTGKPQPVATTVWPWGTPRAVVAATAWPWWLPTAVVAVFPPIASFSFRAPLRLPAVFAIFFLYIAMYLDIWKENPNSLHSISTFIFIVLD